MERNGGFWSIGHHQHVQSNLPTVFDFALVASSSGNGAAATDLAPATRHQLDARNEPIMPASQPTAQSPSSSSSGGTFARKSWPITQRLSIASISAPIKRQKYNLKHRRRLHTSRHKRKPNEPWEDSFGSSGFVLLLLLLLRSRLFVCWCPC